ncbi:hypothetical protein ACKWTF_015890 [Chironomus riparius]
MLKVSQSSTQSFTKTTIYLTLLSLFILITLCPHQSSQQVINTSSTIPATCKFNYTYGNLYTCELLVSVPVNPTDILDISGIHLDNHTDADVEAVSHGIDVVGYFNGEVLRKFANLKIIGMFGDTLLRINPNAFEVCPKLETLIINYGQLTTFPPGMLKNCENLIRFEIMSTNVETLPEDFFGNIINLEDFVAPVNKLTSMPESLFKNMTKLKTFRVAYNKLTELSPNFFINAQNLEEVAVYGNQFQHQDDITYALNGKINLKYLMLDDNNFTNFDFRFFSQFQKLEYLSIGMRRESKLSQIDWQSLPASLTDLRVYGVGEEIPENAFYRTVSLRTLILHGKGITTLHKDLFKPLTGLVFLYIYDTGLKAMHPELFANQINLSNLLISNSQIEELPPGIFTPLVNIGIVNTFNGIQITSSKVQRLNADSFGEHPHLQNIDFSNNEINEIERRIFSKFHPDMVYAGFIYNKCVSENLLSDNLDSHEKLEQCFKNWEEIDPNNRTTTAATPTTTTLGGCGRSFKSYEIFLIIFAGIFKVLFNFIN